MSLKKNILISIAAILAVLFACPLQASFFEDTVHTVHVYFDDPDFWETLDSTHETEDYIICSVVIDGIDTLDSVGIRIKGNSSYNHPGNKKPFHLKFDEYIDDMDYRGNERISFNNSYNDPTFIREKLATEIFHGLGVPCPRACWSVVYYNDVYWGFYSTVDPTNKQAMTRFFGYNDGNLYNCDRQASFEWLGPSVFPYTGRYQISANEGADDWLDLIDFLDFLNHSDDSTFAAGICDRFDAVGFARAWAANTFLVNLDSYQGFGRNYFLCFDYDTIGRYIVYDLNLAFGVFNKYGFDATELRELPIDWYNPGLPPDSSGRPLAERLFDNWPPFRGLVDCALHELLETTLEGATFDARVTELADLVRPFVYADLNKQYTNDNFEANLDDDIVVGSPPHVRLIPGVRDFTADRSLYISGHIGLCDEVDVSGAVLINEVMPDNDAIIADEMGEFDDWFELYNPGDSTVDISYWWVTDDIDEPRKWSFPGGTIIPADGYLLVWADSDPEQGDLHTSFKLSADGEQLALFGSDFIGAELADVVSWSETPTDSSFGRYPNGGAIWQICLVATPGTENIWGTIVADNSMLPTELELSVYPNPFNSAVKISVGEGLVPSRIEIFDINGRIVEDLSPLKIGVTPEATGCVLVWKPEASVASGVYLVRAKGADNEITKRIVYLK